ncbi:MAG: inositol monophosphatase [Spirochaetales bacterium]|nr:inositol monophosphatase [Spirochaetales bacterium]
MTTDIKNILKTAEEAAIRAGEIILQYFNNAKINEKGAGNLVTEADLKSEEAIRKIILKSFPSHSILGEEEGGEENMNAVNLWVIDPLDGTNNYAHGLPMFSVSIAYAEKGEVMAGLVFNPLLKETFTAVKGGGAFLNGKPIKVSNRSLSEALIGTGFYYDRGPIMRSTLGSIQRLFENGIHGIRRSGSAALDLSYVAAGRLDAYFEYKLGVWDFAAGMLILNEAGGDCRDASGKPLSLFSTTFAVCNGVFSDELIDLVRYPQEE